MGSSKQSNRILKKLLKSWNILILRMKALAIHWKCATTWSWQNCVSEENWWGWGDGIKYLRSAESDKSLKGQKWWGWISFRWKQGRFDPQWWSRACRAHCHTSVSSSTHKSHIYPKVPKVPPSMYPQSPFIHRNEAMLSLRIAKATECLLVNWLKRNLICVARWKRDGAETSQPPQPCCGVACQLRELYQLLSIALIL